MTVEEGVKIRDDLALETEAALAGHPAPVLVDRCFAALEVLQSYSFLQNFLGEILFRNRG